MTKKLRSTFWIVSTHLLTTGLAIPALAGGGALALIYYGKIRDPLAHLAVQSVGVLVGYLGGTLYSLAYLRATTQHPNWTDCIKPSIIGFVLLAVLGFTWDLTQLTEKTALSIGILALLFILVIVAFSWLTASGFRRMVSGAAEGTGTLEFCKKTEAPVRRGALYRRLMTGGVGFVLGFILGIWMAMQSDRGGWAPPNGWSVRLIGGFLMGGIGMVLGLVSGPPRL